MSIARFYLSLDTAELANTRRVLSLVGNFGVTPTSDDVFQQSTECRCRNLTTGYDDSWPGLQTYLGHSTYSDPAQTPWYDGTAASTEFHGIWVTKVGGADTIDFARETEDSICSFGVANAHRDRMRVLEFEALLWACTHRGAQFGKNWLDCRLRYASTGFRELNFFEYHPEQLPSSEGDLAWRSFRKVIYSKKLEIKDSLGRPTKDNQQNSTYLVSWGLTALDPYSWKKSNLWTSMVWVGPVLKDITFTTGAPCDIDCTESEDLVSTTCPPTTLQLQSTSLDTCGFCYGVCDYNQYTYNVNLTTLPTCSAVAPQIQINNPSASVPFSGHFFWRPVGSTAECDEVGHGTISGLPPLSTVILDSVEGKAYAIPAILLGSSDPTVRSRERGIVSTLQGAPWSPVFLGAGNWELVLHVDGSLPATYFRLRERMSA